MDTEKEREIRKALTSLNLLERETRFEPLTFGLEMRGFEVKNCIELYRFVILQ